MSFRKAVGNDSRLGFMVGSRLHGIQRSWRYAWGQGAPGHSCFDVLCFLEQNPEEGAEVLFQPFPLESGVELRGYGAVFNFEAGAGELLQHPVAVIFAVGHDERFAS